MILAITQKVHTPQRPIKYTRKDYSPIFRCNDLNNDTFIKKNINFGNNTTKDDLNAFVEKIENDEVKSTSAGWQAKFYKVNDEIGIKAPSPKNLAGDKFGNNNIFEHFILNKIQKIDPNIATIPLDLIEEEKPKEYTPKYYLAMKIVKGSPIDDSNLTKEHLPNLLGHFFKLDKEGIMHFDLQKENVFLESPTKSRLIDFGSFTMLDDNGNAIYSAECAVGNNPKEQLNKISIDALPQQKYARSFLNNEDKIYIKYPKNNPHIKFLSNVPNFEYRTLHDYLINNGKKDPQSALGFFKSYLQDKSISYHSKMKDFLTSIKIDDFLKSEDTSESIEKAKQSLQKAIRHEEISEEVLKNPNDNIIKTELTKIQLRYLGSGNEQIADKKTIVNLYNNFVKTTTEYAQKSKDLEKEYFENTLLSFQDFLEKNRAPEKNTSLPDENNIIKVLFAGAKDHIVNPITSPNPNPPIKKSNTKVYVIIGGILALGGIVTYLLKNQKTKNEIVD